MADRNAPGIAEAIRYKSMAVTDRAMLSRGVSVIRKKTLIVNLPGSPKAVKESLGFILDSLDHGLKILRGSASECARRLRKGKRKVLKIAYRQYLCTACSGRKNTVQAVFSL